MLLSSTQASSEVLANAKVLKTMQWANFQCTECTYYDPETGRCYREEHGLSEGGLRDKPFPLNICRYFHRGRDGPEPRNLQNNVMVGLISMEAIGREILRQAYTTLRAGQTWEGAGMREIKKLQAKKEARLLNAAPWEPQLPPVRGGDIERKQATLWTGLQVRECNEYDPETGICAYENLSILHNGGLNGNTFPNNVCKYFHRGRDGIQPRNYAENMLQGLTSLEAVTKELLRQAYHNIDSGSPYSGAAVREVRKYEQLEGLKAIPARGLENANLFFLRTALQAGVTTPTQIPQPPPSLSLPTPSLPMPPAQTKTRPVDASPFVPSLGSGPSSVPLARLGLLGKGLPPAVVPETAPVEDEPFHISSTYATDDWAAHFQTQECDYYDEDTDECTLETGELMNFKFPVNVCMCFHFGRDGQLPRHYSENKQAGFTSRKAIAAELIRQARGNIEKGTNVNGAAVKHVKRLDAPPVCTVIPTYEPMISTQTPMTLQQPGSIAPTTLVSGVDELPLQPEIVVDGVRHHGASFVKKFITLLGAEVGKIVQRKNRFCVWTTDKRGERLRGFDGMFTVLDGISTDKGGIVIEGATVVHADTNNLNRSSLRFLLPEDTAEYILRYKSQSREDISDALLQLPMMDGWKVVVPRHHGDKKSRKYALLWVPESCSREDVELLVHRVPNMSVDHFTPAYGWGTAHTAEFLRQARTEGRFNQELQIIVIGGRAFSDKQADPTKVKEVDITKVPRILGEDLPRPSNRATTTQFNNAETKHGDTTYFLGDIEATLQQMHNRLSGGKFGEVVAEPFVVCGPAVIDACVADIPTVQMCVQQSGLLSDRTRLVILLTQEENYVEEAQTINLLRGGSLDNVLVLIAAKPETVSLHAMDSPQGPLCFYDRTPGGEGGAARRVQGMVTTAVGKMVMQVLRVKKRTPSQTERTTNPPSVFVPAPAAVVGPSVGLGAAGQGLSFQGGNPGLGVMPQQWMVPQFF